MLGRLARFWRTGRFALLAVGAFMVGGATVVQADLAGISFGNLFSIPMLNGNATTPCSSYTSAAGKVTTTCFAQVDSKGQLAVTDGDTHRLFGLLQFDGNGNLRVSSSGTSTVSGSVSVGNFPSSQTVNGTVNVGNLPGTQPVSGSVNVGNLPLDGSGNVKVSSQGGQSTAPVATKGFRFQASIGANGTLSSVPVNMSLTEVAVLDCSDYMFSGPNGMLLRLAPRDEPYVFPVAIPVTTVEILNLNIISGCNANIDATGY